MRLGTRQPRRPAGSEAAVAPPPGHARFPRFDALRAIAALSVLLFHAAQVADTETGRRADDWWETAIARLPAGVTVFFLVSAFLLYRPFVAARYEGRRPPTVRDFARRRVLRIVPAFWVALVLLFPLGLVWFPGGLWPDSLLIFGFLQAWSDEHFTAGLGVSWSLSVEASFYVVLPLYAAAAAWSLRGRERDDAVRRELAVLAFLGAGSLVLSAVAHHHGAHALAQGLPGTFMWFALGMALAVASAAGRPAASSPWRRLTGSAWAAWGLALAAFGLAAVVPGMPGLGEGFPLGFTTVGWTLQVALYGLFAFFLLFPAVFGPDDAGLPRRILGAPALAWVGLISYGIYLWHTPILGWYREHGPDLSQDGPAAAFLHVAGVALAASLVAGAASYYFVERPVLRFKDGIPWPWPRGERRCFVVNGGRVAPRRARALVTEVFGGRYPAEQLDALRLLVDEVVANGVVHGGVGDDGRIELHVHVDRRRIRVDVRDTGQQGSPRLRSPDLRSGDGFGLFLVSRFASSWGAVHDPALRVWFELAHDDFPREGGRGRWRGGRPAYAVV